MTGTPLDASPRAPPPRACSTSPTRPPTRPSDRCSSPRPPRGLVRVGLPNQDADDLLVDLAGRVSPRVLEAPAQLDEARRELDLYFEGKLDHFDLPLDWRLSNGLPPPGTAGDRPHPLRRDPQLHRRWRPRRVTSARCAPPAPPVAATRCPSSSPATASCAAAAASAATAAASR